MLHGSCLCKAIQYEITEIVGPYVYCHCVSCRKANGSAFAANVSVPIEGFRITTEIDGLSIYESSPGKRRHFCNNCGSPVYTTVGENPKVVRVRLGTLDSEYVEAPSAHIFVGEKAPWHEINDDIDQYQEWPDLNQLQVPGSRQGDA